LREAEEVIGLRRGDPTRNRPDKDQKFAPSDGSAASATVATANA
jgi:hypothetical protein